MLFRSQARVRPGVLALRKKDILASRVQQAPQAEPAPAEAAPSSPADQAESPAAAAKPVEPLNSRRVPTLTTVDLQVAKEFRTGNGRSFNVLFAVANINNANTIWSVRTLTGLSTFRVGGVPTGATNVVPQFGTPTNILGPRIARVGVTYRF